jgi:uncharacterized protein (TIGR04540 family)
MDFLKNPVTIKMLASQLLQASDEYLSRKLSEKQFKELIFYYATNHGNKLFSLKGINPTVINRIGKKRLELVNIMLEGFQYKI